VVIKESTAVQVGDNNNTLYATVHAHSHGLATWSAKAPQRPVPGSPYRGLDAFAESDEDVFFGRDAAITDVMGLLSAVERAQRGRAAPWHPRRLRRLRRGQVLAPARGDTAATAPLAELAA